MDDGLEIAAIIVVGSLALCGLAGLIETIRVVAAALWRALSPAPASPQSREKP